MREAVIALAIITGTVAFAAFWVLVFLGVRDAFNAWHF